MELENENLHWAQNEHKADTLDFIQDTLTRRVFHTATTVFVLYRRLMHSSQLLKRELRRNDKTQKKTKLMSELDRAVEILERLGLD